MYVDNMAKMVVLNSILGAIDSKTVVVKGLAGRTNKERVGILSLHYQNMPTGFGREVRRPLCSPVATTRGAAVGSSCRRLVVHTVSGSRALWIEVIALGAQGFVLTLRPLFALSAFCQ